MRFSSLLAPTLHSSLREVVFYVEHLTERAVRSHNCVASQAMGDAEKNAYMKGQKTLEINPYHPLIQELKLLVRLPISRVSWV